MLKGWGSLLRGWVLFKWAGFDLEEAWFPLLRSKVREDGTGVEESDFGVEGEDCSRKEVGCKGKGGVGFKYSVLS